MRNSLRKALAIVLIVTFVMSTFPQNAVMAYAAPDANTQVTSTPEDTFPMGPSSAVTLESLVDSKGYLTDEGLQSLQYLPDDPQKYTEDVDNSNGTKSVKLYARPVKYKDSNGKYQKIDNSIISTNAISHPQYQYQNAASDVQVLMSNNLNQNNAIQLNYQGYSIGFKPMGVLNSNGVSTATLKFVQTNNTGLQDASFNKSKKYSTLNYSGTFDSNANIEIKPNSTGAKEDIVLNAMPSVTQFSYLISVKNAVPILKQDGNLYFVDLSKGLIVASIPIPCMYDSTPESGSVDIPVTLEKVGTDTYKYTLIPDQSFLQTAIYPVVIDPTVNTRSTEGTYDTEIRDDTSSNYSSLNLMAVGRTSSDVVFRSLVQINQNEIDYIQDHYHGVMTNVSFNAYESYSGSSSPTIEVHPITSAWTDDTVTWDSRPTVDTLTTSQVVQAVGWYSWDVTDLGLDWYYNTTSNYGKKTYGISLQNSDESVNKYKEFNTDENSSYNDYFKFTYTSDTTAPTGSITQTTSGWNQPVTLTCSASDSSGVDDVLLYGRNLLRHSSTAKTGSNEFLKYADIAPIIDDNDLVQYTISFDIKSADISNEDTATVYCQNGSNTKYQFYASVPVTTSYVRQKIVVTPTLHDSTQTQAFLAFYGTYGTGNILSVKNVKVEVGNNTLETLYTAAPEDVYNSKTLTRTVNANGTYHFTVSDYALNVRVISATVNNFDTTKPAPPSIHSVPSTIGKANPVIYWEGATDDNSGIGEIDTIVDGGAGKKTGSTAASGNVTLTTLSEGTHTIVVQTKDNAGNVSLPSNQITYTCDITPPAVNITSPATGTMYNKDTIGTAAITVTGQASDTNMGTWTLNSISGGSPTLINSGSVSISNGTLGTWNLPSLADGVYTLSLDATDKAGNSPDDPDTVQITKDTTIPSTPSINITPPTYGKVNQPVVSWSGATDNLSGIKEIDTKVDSEGWKNTGSTAASGSVTLTALSEGTHTIAVQTIDKAGNTSVSATKVYTYDKTLPVVHIGSPATGTMYNKDTIGTTPITVTGQASDTNMGTWTLNSISGGSPTLINSGSVSISNGTLGTWNLPSLADGVYTLSLDATDKAGNSPDDPDTVQITKDTINPSGTIGETPTDWTNSSATLTCTPSDSGSGVDNVLLGGRNLVAYSDFSQYSAMSGATISNGTATFSGAIGTSKYVNLNMTPYFRTLASGTTITGSAVFTTTNIAYGTTNPWIGTELSITYSDGSHDYFNVAGGKYFGTTSVSNLKIASTYTLKSGVTVASAVLLVLARDCTGTVVISSPKWEVGSAATTYSPAPEDVDNSKTLTQPVSANGTYYFTVSDNAGNVTVLSKTVTNIDTILPSGTIDESIADWTNVPVTLTCSPSDSGGSGVDDVLKGGRNLVAFSNFSQYSSMSGATISGGTATFSGAIGTSKYVFLNMTPYFSKLAPGTAITGSAVFTTTSIAYGTTNPWIGTELNITYSDGSHDYFDVAGGKYFGTTPVSNAMITSTHTLKSGVTVTSAFLNVLTRDCTGTVVISSPKWEVGSAATTYSLAPEDVDNSKTLTQPVSTNGTYYFTVSDNAGNVTVLSKTVSNIETIPPIPPTSVATDPIAIPKWTNNLTPTITWSGITDAGGSLLADVQYQINSGAWKSTGVKTSTGSYTLPSGILTTSGTYTIKVRGVDGAGNIGSSGTVTATYQLDILLPHIAISITPDASIKWTNDTTPVLTWSNFTDTGNSGINRVQYQIGSGSWTDISNSSLTSGTFKMPAFTSSGVYTINVRGIDNAGNASDQASVVYRLDIDSPDTVETLSADVTDGALNSGDTATISLSFDAATDNPDSSNSGIKEYEVEKKIGSGTFVSVGKTSDNSYTLANQPNNSSFVFRIRSWDNAGNCSDWTESDSVISKDRTAPSAPISFKISTSDWTNDTTPTLTWAGIVDGEGFFDSAQYQIMQGDAEKRTWTNIGGADGSSDIDCSMLPDGAYKINLRGKDISGNTGAALSVTYEKDTTAPQNFSITAPAVGEYINNIVDIKGTVNEARLKSWTLEYGSGANPSDYTFLTYGNNNFANESVLYTWNASDLVPNQTYTLRLTVKDTANNVSYITRQVVKGNDPNPLNAPSLQVDTPIILTYNASTLFTYQKANNGGNTGLTGTLYIDGKEVSTESSGQGFNVDMTQYKEGSTHKFFVASSDGSGNTLYSCKTQTDKILNDLMISSSNLETLNNVVIDNGMLKLSSDGNGYASTGYFITNSIPVYNETFELSLDNTVNVPDQTNIDYYYSTDNGTTWIGFGAQKIILSSITSIKIKGVLSSQQAAVTPAIDTLCANALYFVDQSPLTLYLVDAAHNLSSMSNVNHTILLRWDASNASGATYSVYRSTSENGEYTAVATQLTDTYWYDYNLIYGQTFYYEVKAQAAVNGMPRESVASNIVSETVVDQNEINKEIGSKPYWNFASFSTGSGTGKINILSGNLYYQSTDFSQYTPGLNMDMVRAYNSQATYSTPLGYGWDYSFNISLLKEYDETSQAPNPPVVAMLLKDGDGTIYRFVKNSDNTYARPTGDYINLTCTDGVYSVTFKDGTKFIFNNNLQILHIIDSNSNEITFGYDPARGNLVTVSDKVGNTIHLEYSTSPDSQEVDQLIKVTDANGNEFHYTYDNATHKLHEEYLWLDQATNDKYGEVYTYNTSRALWKVANCAGNITSISYLNGKISGATNPLGEELSVAYNVNIDDSTDNTTSTFRNAKTTYHYRDNGTLEKLIDPLGNSTEYQFDDNYNVTQTQYKNRVGDVDNVDVVAKAEYDSNGNLTKTTDPYGNSTYYLDFNSFGKAGTIIKPFTDDDNDGKADYYVKQTFIYYPDGGDIKSESQLSKGTYNENTQDFTAIGDAVGPLTEYTYDDFGNKKTEKTTVGSVESITTYDYDTQGRLTSTTAPDGTVTSQAYNDQGYIKWTVDANNVKTSYYYDTLGRKVTSILPGEKGSDTSDDITETYIYDKNGNVTRTDSSYIKENGSTETDTTLSTFDLLGRSTSTTTAAGTLNASTSSTSYGTPDSNGNYTITDTDGDNVSTTTTYNANGWKTKTESGDTSTTTIYDTIGNAIRTEDSTGVVNVTEYDKCGRTIKTIGDYGGNNHKNSTCTTSYDLLGNVVKSIDASSIVTETTYDVASRPLVTKNTDPSTVPATVSETDYKYDKTNNGKVYTSETDALGHVKEYYYDNCGQLAKEVDKGDIGNSKEMVTEYTYDANGNKKTETRPDGTVVSYDYNDDNSLKKTTYSANFYIEYNYDSDGNETSMIQTKGGVTTTKEWVYDSQNRVKEIKQDSVTILKYEYTSNDSISKMEYPQSDGTYRVIGYAYDAQNSGRITSISDITNSQHPKLIRQYNYDTNGVLTSLQDFRKFDQANNDGDYTEQAFTYDTNGSVKSVIYTDKDYDNGILINSTPRESYALTLDATGNITKESISTNYGTAVSTVKDYEYGAFGRLKTEKVNNDVTASYTYDEVGNRKTLTANNTTLYYGYDEFNSLTTIASDLALTTPITSFTYDDRGNQLTQTDVATSTVTTNSYDLANQLESVKKKVGQGDEATIATYWYDGSGQRTKKVEGSATTRYYYDDLNLLYTDDGTSQRLEENIMEPDGSVLASKRFTGDYADNTYFYRQDIRGSITSVVDKDGTLVEGQTYDAYGKTTKSGDANFVLSFAYTGAVIDDVTGLYYMNARYYNPETGSFLTRDTVEGQLAYGYCDGNPVNSTDLTGHCPWYGCGYYGIHTDLWTCPVCHRRDYRISELMTPTYKLMASKYGCKKGTYDDINGANTRVTSYAAYYYCQGDYKFLYGTPYNGKAGTFAINGCFPASLAMVASTYEDAYFKPAWICNSLGCKKADGGFLVNTFCDYFGYSCLTTTTSNGKKAYIQPFVNNAAGQKKLQNYLDNGYIVIKDEYLALQKHGHYVVWLCYHGTDYCFDPGYKGNNGISISKNSADNGSHRYGLYEHFRAGYYVISPRLDQQRLIYR